MKTNKLVAKILQEGAEHVFKDKTNIVVIESDMQKEDSRTYAAQIFKALRSVKSLAGRKYTLTLELEELPEENPEGETA